MLQTPKHPSLYEINTRVLLQSMGAGHTLGDIPNKFWKELKQKGIDWVWLMGIWEIREKTLDPDLIPEDMMREFEILLPDLRDDDICGSPYAIHDYVIDSKLGTAKDVQEIRKTLHKLGMRLMCDFVPNHLGGHAGWIKDHPEYFIEIEEDEIGAQTRTFYQPWAESDKWFAHGKDPYFDAWQDTVQLNYARSEVHEWMTNTLLQIAAVCDGVRCDMAMLEVKRIFQQTWAQYAIWPEELDEFWPGAIKAVKEQYPGFLFLAECYWDMEAELLKHGFDYCYDKVFFDRMTSEETDKMRQHFHAEPWWLERTSRFLENHDEKRVTGQLALQKHTASAALVAFGPGMRFWHMGQWQGWRKKIPVQLRRAPVEAKCGCLVVAGADDAVACACVSAMYHRVLLIAQEQIFRDGEWHAHIEPAIAGLLLWQWTYKSKSVLVAINYSDQEVDFAMSARLEQIGLTNPVDVITERAIDPTGVVALAPWSVHLWHVKSR